MSSLFARERETKKMENIIIVGILVALFIVGMRATWKHFKGKCSGNFIYRRTDLVYNK